MNLSMDVTEEKCLLAKCEDELTCYVCEQPCTTPRRLNTCGHYLCKYCLPKRDQVCPKCKQFFMPEDICENHSYGDIKRYFTILKMFLSDIEMYSTEPVPDNPAFKINYVNPSCLKRNAKGETKLHLACKKNKLNEVSRLISEGVDVNCKDYAGWAPLHEAIEVESIEIVEELLKNGAIVDIPGEHYITPLHKAVLVENLAIINLLLKYGADKSFIDYAGRKPIDCTNKNILKVAVKGKTSDEPIKITPQVSVPNKIIVYCHSIDDSFKSRLESSRDIKMKADFDVTKEELTHLLVKKSHKLSLKILLGMLKGLIIVPQEWIQDFLSGDFILPVVGCKMTIFEDNKLDVGVKRAFTNHLLKKPNLFDGIKFFVEGPKAESEVTIYKMPITRSFLKLLIATGGGTNLKRAPAPRTVENSVNFPYHASMNSCLCKCCNIIIFDHNKPPVLQYKMPELQHRSIQWLIDCVIDFKLV